MKCGICEIGCYMEDGRIGGCGMYVCCGDEIRERFPDRYLAAVPTAIESMPMTHYHPRGKFLQICTVGCNFKCHGCVSEVLTHHLAAIEGEFQVMTSEEIIRKAGAEQCIGIMFCFNEPTVSYFTFQRIARMAREKGLLTGCSTNGYMTESALEGLIPFLDFVNVGLKGVSEETYRACGVPGPAPIWRNLKTLHQKGVHVEVSIVFRKHGEAEVMQAAEFVSSLSRNMPFQVMRFMPFGDAVIDSEPSVREAEDLCRRLREILPYVYLFNTPGTDYLNTRCPVCGEKVMERGFFGPMGANLNAFRPEGWCSCGFMIPTKGRIHHDSTISESGFFGGYRTVNALNTIRSLLAVLGVTDKAPVDRVLARVLKDEFIKELYIRLNSIDSYFETIDYFASLTGRGARADRYREYVSSRLQRIQDRVRDLEHPAVYCTLGHPLIAMFEDKMESRLIEIAGGNLSNRRVQREGRPGIPISNAQFREMAPDIIIVPAFAAWPVQDFIDYCREQDLVAPAIRDEKVFHLHPYSAAVNPDWILGLMRLAEIFHPDAACFDLPREADEFYHEFYGRPFGEGYRRPFPGLARKETLWGEA